jgi:hypothetical protein
MSSWRVDPRQVVLVFGDPLGAFVCRPARSRVLTALPTGRLAGRLLAVTHWSLNALGADWQCQVGSAELAEEGYGF